MPRPGTLGRPRDASIDARAHAAVIAALREEGWGRLSVEAVVRRAGISRPALYRRWSSLEELVVDAVAAGLVRDQPPRTGDLRADLVAHLREIGQTLRDPGYREAVAGLLSAWGARPQLRERFFAAVITRRRDAARAILLAAAERGELRAGADWEWALDALAGPLYYRALFGHGTVDDAQVEQTVGAVLAALAPR